MAMTITIPTYNRKASLIDAINALVPQLREEDELLVLDDASPDQTSDALRTFPRVRCIRNPVNLGMVRNWNESIRLASNPWICVIHDDDDIASDALATIRKVIRLTGEQPCVIAGGSLESNDQQPLRFQFCEPGRYAVLNAPKIPSGVVVHRAVFNAEGLFDERFAFSPDLEFFPRLARRFPVVLVESPTIVRYRFHDANYQFKTWRDPLFMRQLEQIVRSVGSYAGYDGDALQAYAGAQITYFLKHMMRTSRLQNDWETYRKTSRLLIRRPMIGRRAWIMASLGALFGWCPLAVVQHLN